MPLVLAATLATMAALQPSCSWDRPGQNPYRGNVRDALERYADITAEDRVALKRRITQGQPDEYVAITRDAIRGQREYEPAIRDMHFGAASVCHEVTRSKWSTARIEPGAVYCVKDHCILVPKICGNISRITLRTTPAHAKAAPADSSYRIESHLADRNGGSEPSLADADPGPANESTDFDFDEAQQRTQRALDAIAMAEAADDANRKRQPGQYTPKDDPYQPYNPHNDDIIVPSPVPEARSWAMLLAGFITLGLAQRRRLWR